VPLNTLILNETVNIINVDNLFNITTKRAILLNNFNENYNPADTNPTSRRNENPGSKSFFYYKLYAEAIAPRNQRL
jgi:hypothetical protein